MQHLSEEFLGCPEPDFIIMDVSAWPDLQLFHILPATKLNKDGHLGQV